MLQMYLNTKYMLQMYLNTKYMLQMHLNTKYIDVFKYFFKWWRHVLSASVGITIFLYKKKRELIKSEQIQYVTALNGLNPSLD